MSSRRDNGTGSYSYSEVTGTGRWTWQLRYLDSEGQLKRVQLSSKSKKVLQERVEKFLQDKKDNAAPWEHLTLGQWIKRWLPSQTGTIKIKTYEYYAYMCRKHILNSPFAEMQLKNIRSTHIQTWLYALTTSEIASGGKLLSPGTVNSIRRCVNIILDAAVEQGLLNKRPQSKPISQNRKPPLQVTPEQIKAFLQAADTRDYWDIDVPESRKQGKMIMIPENYRVPATIAHVYCYECYSTMIYFGLNTLCRKGEVLGARWTDINWQEKTFTVTQNIIHASHGITIQTPKTGQYRKILLSDSLINRLKQWKIKQEQYKDEVGDLFRETDLIFTSHVGSVVEETRFRHFWYKLKIYTGLDIRYHDLRHIGTATLLSQGVPIKAVQERGGWATTSILLDTYAYCIPGLQQACVDVLDKNF